MNRDGTRQYLAGHYDLASGRLRRPRLARRLDGHDPRLGTSLNNLGESLTAGRLARCLSPPGVCSPPDNTLGDEHPFVVRNVEPGCCRTSTGRLHRVLHFHWQRLRFITADSIHDQPQEIAGTLINLARLAATCGAQGHAERFHEAAHDLIATCFKPYEPEAALHLTTSGADLRNGRPPSRRVALLPLGAANTRTCDGLGPSVINGSPRRAGRTLRAREHYDGASGC